MKVFLDNLLLKKMTTFTYEEVNVLLETWVNAGVLKENQHFQFLLGWPSFLNYIGLESLFSEIPPFSQSELFTIASSLLLRNNSPDSVVELYDQIFVECLTQVKNLPEIQQIYLLDKIKLKRNESSISDIIFAQSLNRYERLLIDEPYTTLHDLILYLAWDRMCVALAIIFEQPGDDINRKKGLSLLRECLVESFQHITEQGKTIPGFYRLIEALYAYEMREENLQQFSDSEWLILCKSAASLKGRESLIDVFYIDSALSFFNSSSDEGNDYLKYFTLETAEKVKTIQSLANYTMAKLKKDFPSWPYCLREVEIVCFMENDKKLIVNTTLGK